MEQIVRKNAAELLIHRNGTPVDRKRQRIPFHFALTDQPAVLVEYIIDTISVSIGDLGIVSGCSIIVDIPIIPVHIRSRRLFTDLLHIGGIRRAMSETKTDIILVQHLLKEGTGIGNIDRFSRRSRDLGDARTVVSDRRRLRFTAPRLFDRTYLSAPVIDKSDCTKTETTPQRGFFSCRRRL